MASGGVTWSYHTDQTFADTGAARAYYEKAAALGALLSAPSHEEAKALVQRGAAGVEEFEVDIYPVKHFPQFD